jgi:hypothetical protein
MSRVFFFLGRKTKRKDNKRDEKGEQGMGLAYQK